MKINLFLFAILGSTLTPVLGAARPCLAAQFREAGAEIDRVEITGTSAIGGTEIEGALEITAGDRVDRQKVVRTAENIQGLYRTRGYEQVKIQSELLKQQGENGTMETVLRFRIVEGDPTRIAAVSLQLAGGRNPSKEEAKTPVERYWSTHREVLLAQLHLASGQPLDQDKINAAKRVILDAMASEEFIGVRVEDRIEVVRGPAGSGGRWVELNLTVDPGDRVTFGFRGNQAVSRARLLALIEEQRSIGWGKDYVSSIISRIESEYRSMGYAWARVTAYTYERSQHQERHVSFQIEEGTRVAIESLDFDGNLAFTELELRREFYARCSQLVGRRIYVEKDVERAAELLVEWMKSKGYLGAKLVTINRTTLKRNSAVRLLVYIYEGDQTVVSTVKLEGVRIFPETEVLSVLNVQEGQPLNLFAFTEGLEALKARYRQKGYLDAKVVNEASDEVVRYSRENQVADIRVHIDEGAQFRVSRIEIEGATGNRERVIRRELTLVEGGILEEGRIAESESRLRRLGIFSAVTIRGIDDPGKPGFRAVRVSVQEGTPGILAGGLGYRNDLGVRVFGQVAYTDVWRLNHTLSLNGGLNRRINEDFCSNQNRRQWEQERLRQGLPLDSADAPKGGGNCFAEYQVQLAYTWPWFLAPDTTFRPSLTLERSQFRLFDAQSVSLAVTLERKLLSSLNLIGAVTYSLEGARQFNSAASIDNQTLRIGAIIPSIRLDLRDNSLAPTSGFFSSSSFELASPSLGSRTDPYPIGYTRFQFRADGYVPLFKDVVWYLSFRTGIERNSEVAPGGLSQTEQEQYQIPLYKQFSLGGAGSLRGFTEQELNLQHMAIQGTASFVNYRTQLDIPFAGPLRFGPFLDAANLLVDEYSLWNGSKPRPGVEAKMRFGAGVGFHYQTPVGSVNFDWGFKVNPRPGEDPYRFYFSIGVF